MRATSDAALRSRWVGILRDLGGRDALSQDISRGSSEPAGMSHPFVHRSLAAAAFALLLVCSPALGKPREEPELRLQPPSGQLWAQTSAEYRACAMQTYRLAELQLERWGSELIKGPDGKARRRGCEKPVAVILDLDETVIDNIGFQVYQATQPAFRSADFSAWVEYQAGNEQAILAVPGAVRFLTRAQAAGITPFYISNRLESGTASTIKVLERLGLDTTNIERRLLLSLGDGDRAAAEAWLENKRVPGELASALLDGEGRKELRRRQVAEDYEVIAYFGDQLGDFEPYLNNPQNGFALRRQRAEANDERWGAEWFILPNPMYGAWGVRGENPDEALQNMRPLLTDFGFGDWLTSKNRVRAD